MLKLMLLFLLAVGLLALQMPQERLTHEFCWKNTYGRGVGTVPDHCAEGQERIGLFCYPNCPSGMYRWGFDCHSYCPSEPGWADQGLFCRRYEYGRGAGYGWVFGDPLNDSGMIRRCEHDYGVGNCEKHLAMYYPKCSSGYYPVMCCICRPAIPKCQDYNLNPGIDLSCAKKVIIGQPLTGQCSSDQEKDVGLCYPKCDTAYDGVGPVCWGKDPVGWVGCGMGSATTTKICVDTIFNQVMSVGQMALNVVTLGATAAGSYLATDIKKLRDAFFELKILYESTHDIGNIVSEAANDSEYAPIASDAEKIKQVNEATENMLPEDFARIAANIAALVDPTGIAGVVGAFTYPTCSDIFGAYSAEQVHQYEQHQVEKAEKRFKKDLSQKDLEEQQKIWQEILQERKRRYTLNSKSIKANKQDSKDASKAEL